MEDIFLLIIGILVIGVIWSLALMYDNYRKKSFVDIGNVLGLSPAENLDRNSGIITKYTQGFAGMYKNHKVELYQGTGYIPMVSGLNSWYAIQVKVDGQIVNYQDKVPWILNGKIPFPWAYPDLKTAVDDYIDKLK